MELSEETVSRPYSSSALVALAGELEELRDEMRRRHEEMRPIFEQVHQSHRQSAANLIDYLTLRSYDLRPLQEVLAELGLSSLGRAEHVITTLERVLTTLKMLAGIYNGHRTEAAVSFGQGRDYLEVNAAALLGPSPPGRAPRILVTMPTESAEDFGLVEGLLERGMDCARVNCAHDDEECWTKIIENLRRAARRRGRHCPIFMDLPGPKLRTGPIEPGPRVLRLRPGRDAWGRPVRPARALLVPHGGAEPDGPVIPVDGAWLASLARGDRVSLRDTRGTRRFLDVVETTEAGAVVEAQDTTYVATGTRLRSPGGETSIGTLPALEQMLVLRVGDLLTLSGDCTPVAPYGTAAQTSPAPTVHGNHPEGSGGARIGCIMPEAVEALELDHRVFFDDGKIGGVVIARRPGEADIRITTASPRGSKLRSEKGINLPDSDLRLSDVGSEDERILEFIVAHADMVGLSFAQHRSDVDRLRVRLHELGGDDLGIVLKVETVRGFAELPAMILSAMRSARVGVMVARGDLAVECGFERLAEVQEEILWICDAAHLPVIWATQVVDQMARTGQPSRAEVSDAAMAGRAECVMLNKGPYIAEAVAVLDDILRRMSMHQRKKVALLRRLRSWSPVLG
jgi:pyruvate kinase